jgi:hypothetical protein
VDISFSTWIVIVFAIAAANLPFVNERLLGIVPLRKSTKSFWWRIVELFSLYFAVGAIGMGLEARIGNVFAQNWEFFAITGCLFIVLAFPGFAIRYLHRQHRSENS